DECEANFRLVMNIPNNYKVLFLQGGASSQFAMVPMNLMTKNKKADYFITGQFSKKAWKEASKYGNCVAIASSEDRNFSYIPNLNSIEYSKDADYVHICYNNTIFGTVFNDLPQTGDIPLVADMSSNILSMPIDVSKFGLIYAGAQKNMGPAGLTVVIIREDLIGETIFGTPTMFSYKTHAENGSMYNTPPTYSIYMFGLVLKWIKDDIGGLENMHKINLEKAGILYDFLDKSKLFKGAADKEYRSLMNATFFTGDDELDKKFISLCSENGLVNIKGHRSVGGMRASIYNAMPIDGVKKLVCLMEQFEKENI
ncbi:MAG: 3-phosphoserine/phosphohydroxythreonine transaminase, partial [Oscillospiraceae bacterium]